MTPEYVATTVDKRERRLHARRLRFSQHLLRAAHVLDEHRVEDVHMAYQYTISDAPEAADLGMRSVANFTLGEAVLYMRFMAAGYALGSEGVARAFSHYKAVRQYEGGSHA
jgi:hypothetical protein